MTKKSEYARARQASANERMVEIERAWRSRIPSDVAAQFDDQVRAARERGPAEPPPNMAPGTAPRPPRPGREPKAPKSDDKTRRRR